MIFIKTVMRLFYRPYDMIEAQLLADRLRAHSIENAVLRASLASNCILSPVSFPEIWLTRDSDIIRAKAVLEAMQSELRGQPEDEMPDWQCVHCGESVEGSFASCWNCGKEQNE